jgi:hypothetical protein
MHRARVWPTLPQQTVVSSEGSAFLKRSCLRSDFPVTVPAARRRAGGASSLLGTSFRYLLETIADQRG